MARRNSDDLRLLPTLKKFYRIRILRWKKHSFKWFAKIYESFLGMIFMPYLFTTREMWRRSGQKFWKLGNMSSDHNLLYQTYRVTTYYRASAFCRYITEQNNSRKLGFHWALKPLCTCCGPTFWSVNTIFACLYFQGPSWNRSNYLRALSEAFPWRAQYRHSSDETIAEGNSQ